MATWALYKQLFASKFGRRVFAALLVVALFLGGVQLRRWIGESTRHVRYQHDIVNAFYWGRETWNEASILLSNDSAAILSSWFAAKRSRFDLRPRCGERGMA